MSTQFTTGPIDTLPKWNAVLASGCCCEMPGCAAPEKVCESLAGFFESAGFFKGPLQLGGFDADEEWTRYQARGTRWNHSYDLFNETELFRQTGTGSMTWFEGDRWDTMVGGGVGFGEECPVFTPVAESYCEGSGSTTLSLFEKVGEDWRIYFRRVTTLTEIDPDETTPWFQEWRDQFPTDQDYEDAVDAYDAAYAQWEIDHAEWEAGDQEDPEPVLEIDLPPERPEDETFGPCWFRVTIVETEWDYSESPAVETDTTTVHNIPPSGSVTTFLESGDGATTTNVVSYEDPVSLADWFALAEAVPLSIEDSPNCTGSLCSSLREEYRPDFEDDNISRFDATLTKRPARYRWGVPDAHLGTWYRVLWDVLEEPDGWDATIPDPDDPDGPQIPDPDAPARTFVEADKEWVWEGDAFDPDADPPDATRLSGWYQLDPPSTPGTRRVVNVRHWCYRSPYGSLPTLFGEQVEL